MIGILTTAALITFSILVVIFLISALPLYFAVKLFNGKTTLFKTAIITLISGVIVSIMNNFFKTWSTLIVFVLLIWIYHDVFKLNWYKSFFVLIIQFTFIFSFKAVLWFISVLFGIATEGIFN